MSKIRKVHNASFKLKVALSAIREDGTLEELALKYGVHRSQVGKWKNQLEKEGASLFESKHCQKKSNDSDSTAFLYEKIVQLTVERDFLAKVLDR